MKARDLNEIKDGFSCKDLAFSRLEVAVVLGTLALLCAIAMPVLANNRSRSEQIVCLNNLRQVGHGFQLWASEHDDKNPWWVPIRDGGSYWAAGDPVPSWGLALRPNAWFQFAWVSNQLRTPKILVCPSDVGVGAPRKVANDFFNSPAGGFLNAAYKNNAVSYLVGLHSRYDDPRSVLCADRNVLFDAIGVACSSGLTSTLELTYLSQAILHWTNSIHGLAGNVLRTDGSTERLSNFDVFGGRINNGNGNEHFIGPP